MDRSRLEIIPKVWLDYRRAIYLEEHGVLAVADLHLGYTWAHRFNGQMLPFGPGDQLAARLTELCDFYHPRVIALLGDIVHQAVPVAEVADEFRKLLAGLSCRCVTKLILGNHDRELYSILKPENVELSHSQQAGNFLLIHGNEDYAGNEVVVMGHEHPAIALGDGIMGAKFPCFLVSDRVVILPAFSLWAAGTDFRSYPFMSAVARKAFFRKAVAICGNKLLSVPL